MTLLRDHDLARAFDRASHTDNRPTALNSGYRTDLRAWARRVWLHDDGAGLHVLGLGCGMGAFARALMRAAPRAWTTVVEASSGMLRHALAKPWPARVSQHLTAEEVATIGERPFDAVSAGYLFQNVTDPDGVLRTVRTLLRPGGRLVVHESSLSGSATHRALWTAVRRGMIVPAGTLMGDRPPYRHLWSSVLDFDTAPAFTTRLADAGFTDVHAAPVAGWRTGTVHTLLARDGSAAATEHAR
ncbi:methyltransferase domain-containing protein [Streptomyces sp. NPDC006706]|uniref:methyltransferase domain-containing protein n=1 Tax=Streptomyces sp. NPDC006706 TaxID=3364761 RepID=UPI00367398C9